MKKNLKKFRTGCLAVALPLMRAALGACGNSGAPAGPAGTVGTAGPAGQPAAYPIVIQHAFGETVLAQKPERVVSIGWASQDTPLALGLLPVGVSEANYGVVDGGNLLPWTKARAEALGGADTLRVFDDTDGWDFEAINECEPDIILATCTGITQEEYDLLSQIAPTVAYPEKPWQILWRDQVRVNATALGLGAEGEALIEDLDRQIAETLAKYPVLAGKTAAFAYFDPTNLSTISIYTSGDTRAAFLEDLGLGVAPSVRELQKNAETFYLTLSAENADKLTDIDILLTWASGDGSDLLAALRSDPLIGSIPAIQQGAIVMFSEDPLAAAQSPSALSIPYTLDAYVSKIAEAAQQVQ
jgi:iron complex transport system substrate-binding protein